MRRLVTPRTRLLDFTRKPDKLFHGRLAEAYDGIGQYVLVALSGSSTTSAYKARIAAGDFGGNRTFPSGTPVVLASNRGLVEVLSLGNKPAKCFPVLNRFDDFGRTIPVGWGTADSGLIWAEEFSNGGSMSTDGDEGLLTLGPIWSGTFAAERAWIQGQSPHPWPTDPLFTDNIPFHFFSRVKPPANRPGEAAGFFGELDIAISRTFTWGLHVERFDESIFFFIRSTTSNTSISNFTQTDKAVYDPEAYYYLDVIITADTMSGRYWKEGDPCPAFISHGPWVPRLSGPGNYLEIAALGEISDDGPYTSIAKVSFIDVSG